LRSAAPTILLGVALLEVSLAGCATTPYRQATAAARQGRYAEASALYEQALAREPDRLDVLVQLGITRYKLGALEEAIDVLERARARAPSEMATRLFLGLAYLRKNDIGRADENLTLFVDLEPDRRLAAQVDRTLRLMRSDTLSAEMREFAAASLESDAELAQEASEARRALENQTLLYRWYSYPAAYPGPLCVWRGSGLRCF